MSLTPGTFPGRLCYRLLYEPAVSIVQVKY